MSVNHQRQCEKMGPCVQVCVFRETHWVYSMHDVMESLFLNVTTTKVTEILPSAAPIHMMWLKAPLQSFCEPRWLCAVVSLLKRDSCSNTQRWVRMLPIVPAQMPLSASDGWLNALFTWQTAACSMASSPPSGVSTFAEMRWRFITRVNSLMLPVMLRTWWKPWAGRQRIW